MATPDYYIKIHPQDFIALKSPATSREEINWILSKYVDQLSRPHA